MRKMYGQTTLKWHRKILVAFVNKIFCFSCLELKRNDSDVQSVAQSLHRRRYSSPS